MDQLTDIVYASSGAPIEPPKVINLNDGQKDAAEGFFNFLFSEDKELIISGPGGVGKTTLMSHMIDSVMPRYADICKMMDIPQRYTSIDMTATTNKAAEVLAEGTKRPTKTIHSLMNITVRDDYSTGKTLLVKGKSWKIHANKIIFIDESSMIDTPLRNMILEGTHNCKIVYVGDDCQLAPVMEKISPIYKDKLPYFELTEPVRNKGKPALVNVCSQLRKTVKTGIFQPIKVVPGVIDWLDGPAMEREINSHFQQQTRDNTILAYTNNRAIDYNDHIRYQRQLPVEYSIGEILVNNRALPMGADMLRVEEEVEIIDQALLTEKVEIEPGVELEIRKTLLRNQYYMSYRDVPVPVDRQHFLNLIKHYQKTKQWHHYFNLQQNFPDLRQRDSATVHKSQGSTYHTVFIDMEDISKSCRNPDSAARLLYVAFTRASDRVVMYGELASKFGGIIL